MLFPLQYGQTRMLMSAEVSLNVIHTAKNDRKLNGTEARVQNRAQGSFATRMLASVAGSVPHQLSGPANFEAGNAGNHEQHHHVSSREQTLLGLAFNDLSLMFAARFKKDDVIDRRMLQEVRRY